MLLLQGVDFAANHLNLLDMAGDCWGRVSICLFVVAQNVSRLQSPRQCSGSLTLAFVVDAALGLSLELGPDVIEELVEALGRACLGAPHDAGRRVAVVHGGDGSAPGCDGLATGESRLRRAW